MRLNNLFDVNYNREDRDYTPEEIANKISDFEGLITGYGCPTLSELVFEKADCLRIIAHAAGSIKWVLSENIVKHYIIPKGICVCSANKAIAYNVAEATIGLMIMASRRLLDHILSVREKLSWRDSEIPWPSTTLNGSTIGIVSASTVGREVIRLLQPFDVRILVYDPYLSEWEAGRLNVEKTTLDDLFGRSDIVSIHTPLIKETTQMIGERQLKLLHDGAILINTSRGKIIDQKALLNECMTGRIVVVLDVTDPEPLPIDSPFRRLKNVIITPHITGSGRYGYFKIGEMTLQALENYFANREVENKVDLQKYNMLG
ncbi:MAG: hydroxyacid dehydrogenase [Halobacteria archaeon]